MFQPSFRVLVVYANRMLRASGFALLVGFLSVRRLSLRGHYFRGRVVFTKNFTNYGSIVWFLSTRSREGNATAVFAYVWSTCEG